MTPNRPPVPDKIEGPWASALPCTWIQEENCVLGMWLVTSEDQFHPFWSQWVISTIHLRPYEGQPGDAQKLFPEATHELMVITLNPDHGPYLPLASTFQYLTPPNVRVQFVATDEQASHLPWLCARGISVGHLTPEPEGIVGAKELWDSAISTTLNHDKDPHHGQLN